MKKILVVGFLFYSTQSAMAYNPIVVEPAVAYEPILIEGDPYVQREYLGDLADFPEMYEVTSDVSFSLQARVRQRSSDEALPFALIIVRQNEEDGGVEEVLRVNQPLLEWQKVRESAFGITFLEGNIVSKELSPGTYRIEISTPDNRGAYMLMVGDEPVSSGYFKAVAQIYATQKHFDFSVFRLLLSSYVYYPLGIVLVLAGMYATWRYKKSLSI